MRPSPPPVHKLEAASLLADVRDRLADRVPGWIDGEPDPTDPAWLLLEEAAWMVELLSEQLNQYPFSTVRQFVHLMGAELRPARPSLGCVVVQPAATGVMRQTRETPSQHQFLCPQTEERDLIEFTMIEPEVTVRPGSISSLSELRDGRLLTLTPEERGNGIALYSAHRGEPRRSAALDRESIEYVLTGSNQGALLEQATNAIEALAGRRLGWLALNAEKRGSAEVVITATIDPAGAFAETTPSGMTADGDLLGYWGTLEGSPWQPAVLVRDHAAIPGYLRGKPPLPGSEEGTILLPDLPGQLEVDGVLRRVASPIPEPVLQAIWQNLTYVETRLSKLRPTITRKLPPPSEDGEARWVGAAVHGKVWSALRAVGTGTIAHIELPQSGRGAGALRLGLVLDEQWDAPRIHAYGSVGGHLETKELPVREVWSLPAPSEVRGSGFDKLLGLDVLLNDDHDGVILLVEGAPFSVLLNPLLVANTPLIDDGRVVTIERAVPESASLQYEDLVTPQVMEQLLEQPIPPDAAAHLSGLPLARFSWRRGQLNDYEGLSVDPSKGELRFNAPDRMGTTHRLRPGTDVRLDWYRRTDGAAGDVEAGAIEFVEAPPSARPRITAVRNPVGTFFGADRESDAACQERVFGPSGDAPILPADWERALRAALGDRGRDWLVRCWTYSERSLMSHWLWPLPAAGVDPETEELRERLRTGGPELLLFVVGPQSGHLDDKELDWTRQVVRSLVNRARRRNPSIRDAVVAPLWPLRLEGGDPESYRHLPAWDLAELSGELVDDDDRRARAPGHGLLLNAAVVSEEKA